MHFRCSLGVIGYLVLFIGCTMLLPAGLAFFYGEVSFLPLLISSVSSMIAGFIAGKVFFDEEIELNLRDGFFIVSVGWIMMALFGALPFWFSGEVPRAIDAWFESASGFTTTGSTILEDVEILSHGLLLWRSMSQWIGGMGIIVLSIALLPLLGVGGMQLYKAEVPGPTIDKVKPRVRDTAMTLWKVYVMLTVAVGVLYFLGGMTWFEALNHALTTMATGGFSTRNASIGGFDSAYISIVSTVFMFLAGTNFIIHYRWMKGDIRPVYRSTEFRWYAGITVIAILFITVSTVQTTFDSVWVALKHSSFQVVSILTTTGYGSYDYNLWAPAVQFLLLVFMFIGGMSGSTAGGIKIVRILLLMKNTTYEMRRILHPNAIIPLRLNKEKVTQGVINEIMAFIFIFISVFILGTFVLSATGLDFMSSIGATASAMGNIGPGLATVGPTDTYAHLHPVAKLMLTVCMLLGRLELFTIMIILTRGFWRV
jgi:trk system potassium uptake protein